jgi:hypothetical protein
MNSDMFSAITGSESLNSGDVTTPEPQLLPCPFCGGEAQLDWDCMYDHYVGCTQCLTVGCTYTARVYTQEEHDRCRANAIAMWNRRVPLAPTSSEPIVEKELKSYD